MYEQIQLKQASLIVSFRPSETYALIAKLPRY